MASMKIEKISKEVIKPSDPTPPHLKAYKLSLLDQLTTSIYIPFAFFYTAGGTPFTTTANISHRLKKSLSEILTRYYPFAGRLIDGSTIDCTDEGVEFLEAHIHCQLSRFLKNSPFQKDATSESARDSCISSSGQKKISSDDEAISVLFPAGLLWHNSSEITNGTSLVGVQLTIFDCGGFAVGVCISHKIADGCTISRFLNDWAAIARGEQICGPEFINGMSFLQPSESVVVPQIELEERNCVTKRFVFNASQIAHLKAIAADPLGLKSEPTRVEVVAGLLYKCLSKAKSGPLKQSLLIQMVNMRTRITPPLAQNSIGNFTWYFTISTSRNMTDDMINLSQIVDKLKVGKASQTNLDTKDWMSSVLESTKMVKTLFDDLDVFRCSSLCRYPWYEVDFGWGNPMWVRMANGVIKNFILLMDTRDGEGIEALVTLEEKDMDFFQCDEELLAFATSNPSCFSHEF